MSRLKLLVVAAMAFGLAAIAAASSVMIIGGRPMVPLRSLRDEFGASINYDSRDGFSVSLDYHTARVRPGYRQAWIDDRPIYLDADAVIINGVLYVPMGFVSDAFGYDCQWNPGYQQVIIIQPRTHHRVSYHCDRPAPRVVTRVIKERSYPSRPVYRDKHEQRVVRVERKAPEHRYDRRPAQQKPRVSYQSGQRRSGQHYSSQRSNGNNGKGHAYGQSKDKGNGKGKGRGHRS